MALPYEVIKAKRDGRTLTNAEIGEFVAAYARGDIPDYQMSAMCMAVYFRGLDDSETAAWTRAMLHSGTIVDLGGIPGAKVDKHSTGGVGDKVSLAFAPIVAACGVSVPMISGRGLGHTGGTLDKLESIPGFQVNLGEQEYVRLVREVGACLIGQTRSIAPADKKLYALRDVTATVDCIPLIASSIMSKKLAEGIDALVLDVKVGSGAFMRTIEDARKLAQVMTSIAHAMGKKVNVVLSDMSQPLGRAVGNVVEVVEATEVLQGGGPADFVELTLHLSALALVLAGKAGSVDEGLDLARSSIRDGRAYDKWLQIVSAQGGAPSYLRDTSTLRRAHETAAVIAPYDGYVASMDCEAIGLAAVVLGAGRSRAEATVDHSVGMYFERKIGDAVRAGDVVATVLANDVAKLAEAHQRVADAISFSTSRVDRPRLILE